MSSFSPMNSILKLSIGWKKEMVVKISAEILLSIYVMGLGLSKNVSYNGRV